MKNKRYLFSRKKTRGGNQKPQKRKKVEQKEELKPKRWTEYIYADQN